MKTVKTIIHIIASAFLCFLTASFMHTQNVLNRLVELDINIAFSDRVRTVFTDLVGLAPTYGFILLIGLSLSFLVTSFLIKKWAVNSTFMYALGGCVAVATILLVMQPILGVTILGGARGLFGFMGQCLGGLVGGALFGALRYQRQQ